MQNYIVGLDIGTSSIKCVVGEVGRDGKLSPVQVLKMPSGGLRKGMVDDISEATYSVNNILSEARKISKTALKNIYLSVGSADIKIQSSRGSVAVSRADNEIDKEDINRAIEASRAIPLPPNRMILHAITKEFIVDGVGDIQNPSGMMGNKLEVVSLIVDSFVPSVKNLTKCAETAGGSIAGLILAPIAAARAILTKNQKELGVALIDIGFGKTGLSVYEESKLVHAAILPVGSGNITNDLAIALKIPISVSETVKLSFGSAVAKDVSRREIVDLTKIDAKSRGLITKKFISEIIEARLAEIFEFVNNELKHINKHSKLPAGVILVGGGAKLPGIVELAKQELRLPAQIGIPDLTSLVISNNELTLQLEDPDYACVLGLLLWGCDKNSGTASEHLSFRGSLRKVLGYFLP